MRAWLVVLLAVGFLGCQAPEEPLEVDLENTVHKRSYGIGVDIAHMLEQQKIQIDPEIFIKGFQDQYVAKEAMMTPDDVNKMLANLQKEMASQRQAEQKKLGEDNKKTGDVFLAQNKNKEGVQTLPSGLQYKAITTGTGPKPSAEDTVSVHYRGTLIDGTEFDSSYKRGEPATFPLNGVIRGWTEGLQLMPVGSKWTLFVPSNLGYGPKGVPGIGPNSTLIFEVELLEIK